MPQTLELPKKYKKELKVSYALGPFPTFKLLESRPKQARAVYVSQKFNEREKLEKLCADLAVPLYESEKALSRISEKDVCYAAGEFEKYSDRLDRDLSHIALVEPRDMGNLGSIERTALAFGIRDLAIIGNAADIFNPRAVRASMGAVFSLRVELFSDFEEYLGFYGTAREIFPFMLRGADVLTPDSCPLCPRYTLVFGNEASGLPESFAHYGRGLFIEQTADVDSLNLASAVAIGTYIFTQRNKNLPR